MRRLLAFLLMVSLLVAPCASAELTIFAAGSLSDIFVIQDEQPAYRSKSYPCSEHAQSKELTPVHEKCGADCLTWLSGEEFVLSSPLVRKAVKEGLAASVFCAAGPNGCVFTAETLPCRQRKRPAERI